MNEILNEQFLIAGKCSKGLCGAYMFNSGTANQPADPQKKSLGWFFCDTPQRCEYKYKEVENIEHRKSLGNVISCDFCFKR